VMASSIRFSTEAAMPRLRSRLPSIALIRRKSSRAVHKAVDVLCACPMVAPPLSLRVSCERLTVSKHRSTVMTRIVRQHLRWTPSDKRPDQKTVLNFLHHALGEVASEPVGSVLEAKFCGVRCLG
jgi:hypothetical protein